MKDLIASSLTPMILIIISRHETYGYEIIQHIKEKSDNKLNIAEGTLYPVLKKMEDKGWITANWKTADNRRERKYYKITKRGLKELGTQAEQWDFFYNLIQELWQPRLTLQKR